MTSYVQGVRATTIVLLEGRIIALFVILEWCGRASLVSYKDMLVRGTIFGFGGLAKDKEEPLLVEREVEINSGLDDSGKEGDASGAGVM